jgi:hypothetical protein
MFEEKAVGIYAARIGLQPRLAGRGKQREGFCIVDGGS